MHYTNLNLEMDYSQSIFGLDEPIIKFRGRFSCAGECYTHFYSPKYRHMRVYKTTARINFGVDFVLAVLPSLNLCVVINC